MSQAPLEADYVVVGGGASAMAFVDTLLSEHASATLLMVDRHHRPGGHWNDAYPFVRLHQPSEYYGVASRELSDGTKDSIGHNAGLYGQASGEQVLDYFNAVMQTRFLPSGRVQWLPMSDAQVEPGKSVRVTSLTTGAALHAAARRMLVDATLARTEVPSTHPPVYAVGEGVACVPLNALPQLRRPYARYTVVGSGKTGMDAVLWLMENGVPVERIRWVRPRDPWLLNRANVQPGLENFERSVGSTLAQLECIEQATSVPELFQRLEARELLLRFDPQVEPTTYRCAVVSPAELAQLRRVQHVVRLGRVRRIEPTRIECDRGVASAEPDTLYIDCSAAAIVHPPKLPVFDGDRINLLMVRMCQPTISAAMIACVESHVDDAVEKNALCGVMPSPEYPVDWLRMWLQALVNGNHWRKRPELNAWLMRCRLNAMAVYARGVAPDDKERIALLQSVGRKSGPAASKLKELLAEAPN